MAAILTFLFVFFQTLTGNQNFTNSNGISNGNNSSVSNSKILGDEFGG